MKTTKGSSQGLEKIISHYYKGAHVLGALQEYVKGSDSKRASRQNLLSLCPDSKHEYVLAEALDGKTLNFSIKTDGIKTDLGTYEKEDVLQVIGQTIKNALNKSNLKKSKTYQDGPTME
jgi:hypothetical protein